MALNWTGIHSDRISIAARKVSATVYLAVLIASGAVAFFVAAPKLSEARAQAQTSANHGTESSSDTSASVKMGRGNSFGLRYPSYVDELRKRIRSNWFNETVPALKVNPPRAYFTFEVTRDGTVRDVQVKRSSGVPEVDYTCKRAILASNPLPRLPDDYVGESVDVQFYFDFHRQ